MGFVMDTETIKQYKTRHEAAGAWCDVRIKREPDISYSEVSINRHVDKLVHKYLAGKDSMGFSVHKRADIEKRFYAMFDLIEREFQHHLDKIQGEGGCE